MCKDNSKLNNKIEVVEYVNYQTGKVLDLDKVIQLKDNVMLKVRPELWIEWDFEKNEELGFDIWKITKGSEKEPYWHCFKCLNSFKSLVFSKRLGKNCSYCYGKKVNTSNSIATTHPHLLKQWHPTKNIGVNPIEFSKGSRKKIWWLCAKGHEWENSIGDRTRGKNCPYCCNQKIDISNCLATLNPQLTSQWHPTLNGELTPYMVGNGSKKKVWWKCDKNHEWEADIGSRSKNKRGCPYCSGLKFTSTNSLAYINPQLASEWHPTKNGELTPYDISKCNGKKVWWLGICGHQWEAKISNRNTNESKCPYCSNNKVLKGFNDMWTTNPSLASLLLNPEDGYKYIEGSNVKLNWKCSQCSVIIRNRQSTSIIKSNYVCNNCSDGFSYPEKVMFNLLRELNSNFIYETSFEWSNNKRYDFYIPSLNIIIETHGMQHFEQTGRKGARTLKDEQSNDRYKYELAIVNGVKPENYIIIDCRYSDFEFIKNNVLNSRLAELFDLSNVDWDIIWSNSQKSIVFEIVDLWDKGLSTMEISMLTKCGKYKVVNILKKASKMGICSYNQKESTSRSWKFKRLSKYKTK